MPQTRPDIHINSDNSAPSSVGNYYYTTTAVHDGLTDAQPQLQADIDYCILNGISALFLPKGTYIINKPLFIATVGTNGYGNVTLRLFGESSMWDAPVRSKIKVTYTDTFAIGIQQGKGCRIEGLEIEGKFKTPVFDNYNFFNSTIDNYTDGVCRDSRYSPYSGIVIDPFTRNGSIPGDGGYPGMTSFYVLGPGNPVSGSTATIIENVIINSFVIGVCSSPNGITRNAELTRIENIRFVNVKVCIAGGQDQEKDNEVRHLGCWGSCHTVFCTGYYGAGTHGHWIFDGMNLAGRVVRVVDNQESGYFPCHFSNIYAESLGKFGTLINYNGSQAATVNNCMMDFEYPESGGMMTVIDAVGNVSFNNCTFRYYGTNLPMLVAGNPVFYNCSFNAYVISPVFNGRSYITARFVNCFAGKTPLGDIGIKQGLDYVTFCYGDWTLNNFYSDFYLKTDAPNVRNTVSCRSLEQYDSLVAETNIALTPVNREVTFTSADANAYYVGVGVMISGSQAGAYGAVTAISGNSVTISYLPSYFAFGTYTIRALHPLYFFGMFIGDTHAGINQITNCRDTTFFGGLKPGYIVKNPYGGSRYIRILTVVGTTLTFYGSITTTVSGAIFGNYDKQEVFTDTAGISPFIAGTLVRRGDKVTLLKGSENSVEYTVTKGGFLSGDTDARQAQLQIAY